MNELTNSVRCFRAQERTEKSKLEALINTEKVKQAERAMRKKGRRKEALCGIDNVNLSEAMIVFLFRFRLNV